MASLDPERWRTLSPLLDRMLDLAEPDRASLLAQLRAYSPELATELSALLASDTAASDGAFLESRPEIEREEPGLGA